jgi:hypothetical protein
MHLQKLKKIAISQSNYIPWKGYFDLINSVDDFVFFDEVQFTRRDWRNRNKIIINNLVKWITIPIKNKGNYKEKINKVIVNDTNWKTKHMKIFKQAYRKSKFLENTLNILDEALDGGEKNLSSINQKSIITISKYFNISTNFFDSSDFMEKKIDNLSPSMRLIQICKKIKASIYVSGPLAKEYLDIDLFKKNNIEVQWFDYPNNKKNKKENLSVVDNLMNYGIS